mmetsp:Transcript_25280/g.75990  ORF Transcript_25280/g.75990 Transcript_25280/m.75990 type:complete len:223 (-) Transcript_25280:692-1360(-)
MAEFSTINMCTITMLTKPLMNKFKNRRKFAGFWWMSEAWCRQELHAIHCAAAMKTYRLRNTTPRQDSLGFKASSRSLGWTLLEWITWHAPVAGSRRSATDSLATLLRAGIMAPPNCSPRHISSPRTAPTKYARVPATPTHVAVSPASTEGHADSQNVSPPYQLRHATNHTKRSGHVHSTPLTTSSQQPATKNRNPPTASGHSTRRACAPASSLKKSDTCDTV